MSASLRLLCSVILALGSLAVCAQNQVANGDWTKAGAADSGLSEAKLRAMSAAVRSEEFKKNRKHSGRSPRQARLCGL